MRVPHALRRENAGYRSLSVQAARNGVRLGFEMLRLTARCCGEAENLSAARASECGAIRARCSSLQMLPRCAENLSG